jgi:DNA-binding NtrC family response regulator
MQTIFAVSPRPSTRLALRHVLARLGVPHEILCELAELQPKLRRKQPALLLLDARLAPLADAEHPILWLIDESSPRPAGDSLHLPQELEQLAARLPGRRAESAPLPEAVVPPADEPIALRPLERMPDRPRPHRSRAWAEVERQIAVLALHDLPVLIQGESGTGKELVARALHAEGPRAEQPFVAVHCGAIPADLLESELFGHERGAFTDAHRRRIGRFEAAGAGTILLDEIGEMPLALQSKLLRVLQERQLQRVGGDELVAVRARVLAATHRDLQRMARHGAFREDLLHRLLVGTIRLPPLRERPDDLELLAQWFLARLQLELGRTLQGIETSAWQQLQSHDWPGNVRELEHLLRRAALRCDGRIRQPDLDLQPLADEVGATLQRWLRERLQAQQPGAEALDELRTALEAAATKLGITPARPGTTPPRGA